MTIKLGSLAADLSKERDGEWIEPKEWPGLDPEKPFEQTALPGVKFLVRSTHYPAYVTARQAVLESLKKDYPDDKVPADVAAREEGQLAIQHLLLDWQGFDVKFSADVASTLMSAEEHRVLRQIVFWCAGRVGKRKLEFVEASEKK